MKMSVGSILALVTLIGTILVGGSNFGELRAMTNNNTLKIQEQRMRMEETAIELRRESLENMRVVAKMSADIEWIKETLRRNTNGH